MKTLVLCAGMGTRLGDLTINTPKPMLPICEKPLLAYTLEYLAGHGLTDIAINLHYHAEQIRSVFKDGSQYGVRISYFDEEKLLGTAGALRNMTHWLVNDDCLVVYGDILTDQDLSPLIDCHTEKSSFATLLVHKRKKSNSIVKIDAHGQIVCFRERPSEEERRRYVKDGEDVWVNSGVQIVSNRAVKYIVEHEAFDLPRDVYCNVYEQEAIFAVPLTGFRVAIDSPERYEQARQAVMASENTL